MAFEATAARVHSPSYQAFQILHIAFTVAPIVAGIDKFFHFLANWEAYLAPVFPQTLGIDAGTFMLGVGPFCFLPGLAAAKAMVSRPPTSSCRRPARRSRGSRARAPP